MYNPEVGNCLDPDWAYFLKRMQEMQKQIDDHEKRIKALEAKQA